MISALPGKKPEPSRNRLGTNPEPTWDQPGSAGLDPGRFRVGSEMVPGWFRLLARKVRDKGPETADKSITTPWLGVNYWKLHVYLRAKLEFSRRLGF